MPPRWSSRYNENDLLLISPNASGPALQSPRANPTASVKDILIITGKGTREDAGMGVYLFKMPWRVLKFTVYETEYVVAVFEVWRRA